MPKSIKKKTKKTKRFIKNKTNKRVKFLKKKHTKKISNKGGMSGLTADPGLSSTEAFNKFIDNSEITYFSKGANGFTFLARFKSSEENLSPYVSTDAKTYNEHVNVLLIKIAFLHNLSPSYKNRIEFSGNKNVALTSEQDFNHEIDIQKDVYFKTMDYLEPICPAIVYSKVEKDRTDMLTFLKKLQSKVSEDDRETKNLLLDFISLYQIHRYKYIGIIGMEFAEGYSSLFRLIYILPKKKRMFEEMSMYLLLELADKAGYAHGDFHSANIMINASLDGYFYGISGKPLLIDFGYATPIDPATLGDIKQLYFAKNYTAALQQICRISRSDGEKINSHPSYYGWACGYVDPDMDMDEIKAEVEDRQINKMTEYQKKPEIKRISDREIETLDQEVLDEMAAPENARFREDTNQTLAELYQNREIEIEILKSSFNEIHPEAPSLPLSIEEKQKLLIL
jgi:thiamine kinase-like enzyme